MPKLSFSIITPSYNQGEFIKKTIDSVLAQNYSDLDYYVVDGNSTDSTIDILQSYGRKIRWISEKDSGQTSAINKGLRSTDGEIVAYLNSDDMYCNKTLSTVAQYFENNPDVQWITGNYEIIDTRGRKIQSYVVDYKSFLRKFVSFPALAVANSIAQPSTFWRRSFLEQIGYFDESLKYCMDYEYWLKCIKVSSPLVVPEVLSKFRIHQQSKGGAQYDQQFAEEHLVLRRFTRNPLLLLLHKLHTTGIITAYRFIK